MDGIFHQFVSTHIFTLTLLKEFLFYVERVKIDFDSQVIFCLCTQMIDLPETKTFQFLSRHVTPVLVWPKATTNQSTNTFHWVL